MSNDERKVYISYAWGGESGRIANELDAALQASGITVIRDKRDLGYKGMIRDFMQQIGRGYAIVVIISDKYLKSPNCMYELVEIARNKDVYYRIFPVVLEDADIYDPVHRIKYIKYWEEKLNELDEALKSISSANQQGLRDEIDSYDEIRDNIAHLTFLLKDMNTLTKEMHEDSDFSHLLSSLRDRLNDVDKETYSPKTATKEPPEDLLELALRKLGHPTRVYHRIDLENQILDNILGNEHPIIFIHGLPGSGKTILLGETAKNLHDTHPNIFTVKFSGVFSAEPSYFVEELNEFLNRSGFGVDRDALMNRDWRHSLETLVNQLPRAKQSILLLDAVDQAPEGLIDTLTRSAPQTKIVMTARSRIISDTAALFLTTPPLQEMEIVEFLRLFGFSPEGKDEVTNWLERVPKKIMENPQRLKLLIANLRDIPLDLLLIDGVDEISQHPSMLISAIIQDLSDNTLRVLSLIILLEGLELFPSLKALNLALPKGLGKALTELLGKSLIYRQKDAYLIPSLVRGSAIEKIPQTISSETVRQVEKAIQDVSNTSLEHYEQSSELFPIIANFFVHLGELEYHDQIINLATEDLLETMNLQGFWKEYRLILRITYEAAKLKSDTTTLAAMGLRIVRKSFQIRDMQSGRQALSELQNILEALPDSRLSAELLSHQALFTELDGDPEGALAQLQSSLEIYKKLGDTGSMSIIQNLIGNIYLRKKEIAEARESYEAALRHYIDEPKPSKQRLEVEISIAVCDFIERKLEDAQARLRDVIENCKKTGYLAGLPRAYYFLALVLDQENRSDEALRFAEFAAELALKSEQSIARGIQVLIWKLKDRNPEDLEVKNDNEG